MKDVIIKSTMNNISKNFNYDQVKLLEIKYGLETLYLTITKTIVMILLSLILGITKELLIFTAFYGLLRLCGFGLHAKKSWHCWITSLIIFVFIPLSIKYIIFNNIYILPLLVLCLFLLIIYAPADTEKRPLISKKKRTIFKIITVFITIIYIIFILKINNNIIKNSMMFAIILQTLLVLPISYKLMGLKYKNYINYKKGGQI